MFYQMNLFMLTNELIQYFRNTSIATAVRYEQRNESLQRIIFDAEKLLLHLKRQCNSKLK